MKQEQSFKNTRVLRRNGDVCSALKVIIGLLVYMLLLLPSL